MNQALSRLAERARTAAATSASDAYIYRTNVTDIDHTNEVADGVFIDYDADDNVVGVEVLDVVRTVVTQRVPFEEPAL